MKKLSFATLFISLFIFGACTESPEKSIQVDSTQLVSDLEYLSSDEMKGRFPGTEESRQVQDFIEERFQQLGLSTFNESFRQVFNHTNPRNNETFEDVVNMIGYVEGTENPDEFIVLTAHYDHLGIRDGEIFNGADDNASGTGGLLAAADWFSKNPPSHSIMFIAFDVEEQGLGGARYFVENPTVPLDQIALNINMDMISNNFADELYAVGTFHYPYLKSFVEEATADAPISVLFGYDSDEYDQDWTMASDHGPFHTQGVPFIYFGVEDHPHYHAASDTFENTNPEFYVKAVSTILSFVHHADQNLPKIRSLSDR